jgi:Guanyl-specific ribonuclease Sa
MKKVLSLWLILLLVLAAGCAPRPAQTEFVQLTAPPATAAPTEAPVDDSLVLLTAAPQGEAPAPTAEHRATDAPKPTEQPTPAPTESPVQYGEDYDDKDRVALYLHLYGELPPHFITKKEAQKLGWDGGEVEYYRTGAAIGGDYFGNYEGLLPKKKGRSYYECDIDTVGKRSRGAKRIIYSNDGLIYYTDDHYESFTLLYGEE